MSKVINKSDVKVKVFLGNTELDSISTFWGQMECHQNILYVHAAMNDMTVRLPAPSRSARPDDEYKYTCKGCEQYTRHGVCPSACLLCGCNEFNKSSSSPRPLGIHAPCICCGDVVPKPLSAHEQCEMCGWTPSQLTSPHTTIPQGKSND